MIGLNVRLMPIPEQAGEPRISVHWFFVPVGFGLIAAGLVCLRYGIVYVGWGCAFLGLFEFLTFGLCERRIRAGKPPEALFTLPLRKTVLACSMFGYLVLFAIVHIKLFGILSGSRLGQMVLFVFGPVIWVLTAQLLWNAIVRYFVNHPPKQ